jgi:hypothetical protein
MGTSRSTVRSLLLFLVALAWLGGQLAAGELPPAQPQMVFAPGDPNRDPRWDWTKDVNYTLYANTASGLTAYPNVTLPYFTNIGPADVLNNPAGRDILPADGWVLAYRDFGTPTRGATMPLFILYNRYRGILRFFVYNSLIPQQVFTMLSVHLTQPDSTKAMALFNFASGGFLSSYNPQEEIVAMGAFEPQQWSYVDFQLAYDPTPKTDARLHFHFQAIDVTDTSQSGTLTLNQVLSEADINTADPTADAAQAIKVAANDYHTVSKAIGDLNQAATKSPSAWWVPIVKPLLTGTIANLVPGLASVAGFISSLIAGPSAAQNMPLDFTGQIQLSGQNNQTLALFDFELAVPGTPHSDPNDPALPLFDQPVGIFNLSAEPVLTLSVPTICQNQKTEPTWTCLAQNGFVATVTKPVTIYVNPLPDATVTTLAGFVHVGKQTFFGSSLVRTGTNGPYGELIGCAVEIKIQPKSAPAGQAPFVVMHTFPVTVLSG